MDRAKQPGLWVLQDPILSIAKKFSIAKDIKKQEGKVTFRVSAIILLYDFSQALLIAYYKACPVSGAQ